MSPRELDDETKHIARRYRCRSHTAHTTDRSRARAARRPRGGGRRSGRRRTRFIGLATRGSPAGRADTIFLSQCTIESTMVSTRAGRTRDDRSLNHAPTERVRPRPTTRAASGGGAQSYRSCGHGCMRHNLQKPNHKPAADAISGIPCTSSCSIRGLFTWPRGASCACRSRPAVVPLSTARRENNCPIGNCPIGPSPPAERGELFRAPGARQ